MRLFFYKKGEYLRGATQEDWIQSLYTKNSPRLSSCRRILLGLVEVVGTSGAALFEKIESRRFQYIFSVMAHIYQLMSLSNRFN